MVLRMTCLELLYLVLHLSWWRFGTIWFNHNQIAVLNALDDKMAILVMQRLHEVSKLQGKDFFNVIHKHALKCMQFCFLQLILVNGVLKCAVNWILIWKNLNHKSHCSTHLKNAIFSIKSSTPIQFRHEMYSGFMSCSLYVTLAKCDKCCRYRNNFFME